MHYSPTDERIRPGFGIGRPHFGIGRPHGFGFGLPFITGLAAGALLSPGYPYLYPYSFYPPFPPYLPYLYQYPYYGW